LGLNLTEDMGGGGGGGFCTECEDSHSVAVQKPVSPVPAHVRLHHMNVMV
jgi:hypothetical protein